MVRSTQKKLNIVAGKVYERRGAGRRPLQRRVLSIEHSARFNDPFLVTYEIVVGAARGTTRSCTLTSFRGWAEREQKP